MNRSIENANRITAGAWGRGLLLGLAALLAACTRAPAAAAARIPIPRRSISRSSISATRFPRTRTTSPASARSSRTTNTAPRCGSATAPPRAPRKSSSPPACAPRPWAAARRPLRHQGSRRRARWPARGLRDARPAGRFRRGRAADLEHLGIQHRDRHAASRDLLGHHRRGRPGRRARLSTRRPHPVLLDAPAPVQGHPARREQGAVRSRQRDAQRIGVRAARHERGRHRHPPDHASTRRATCTRSVLQNGRVLFTRWDTGGASDGLHLYTTNPDGTDTQLHYGALSHATGTNGTTNDTNIEFMRAREMSDGRLMVLVRERTDVDFGGNLTIIDANTYVENHAAAGGQRRHAGPRADAGHAQRRAHHSRPLARRPLRVGLPAVGWLGPHPRELVAVPPARRGRTRSDTHRSLRRRTRSPIRTC